MKKYKVIYADPPWAYKVWSKKGAGRSAESHYPTMDLAAIKALPVSGAGGQGLRPVPTDTFPHAAGGLGRHGRLGLQPSRPWPSSGSSSAGSRTACSPAWATGRGPTRRSACWRPADARKQAARDVSRSSLPCGRHSQKPEREARQRIEALMGGLPALSCSQSPTARLGCGEMKLQAISGLRKGCEPLAYVTVLKDLTKSRARCCSA